MVDDAQRAGGGDGKADRQHCDPLVPSSPANARDERLFIGAMSGTSADGVDAALVAVGGFGRIDSAAPPNYTCRLLRHVHVPYDDWLRNAVCTMRQNGGSDLRTLARVTRDASLCYAKAVHELVAAEGLASVEISAIAAHGQTIFHAPPCTMQLLDPSLLAAETECSVVSDFRRADCAAGGQGAPLVPFADYILFRDPVKSRVLLNIGGIANVTYLPPGGGPANVIAFDTGPGNCVSDHLMRLYDPQGPGFDRNGEIAKNGQAIYPLMSLMLSDPYFQASPPKSTDGPAMIQLFAKAYETIGRNFPFENLMRTACLLSATTIADAIRRFWPFPDELIVSGGGTKNATLMCLLKQPLGDMPVRTSDELGVPSDAKEAMAFALLGAATIDCVPGNIPTATGAKKAVVLGSVTPKP
ncbi:anhydro-N-acetylmuramic acid kinase [Humisphaera borealis]|uniref:Anhydro-N-acetylmuramic acid kinase n=1 Tax=Humisphaera borealis TaxID=2807512 RepID=A0A7M2WSV1_9BACT|nr:anhydro-N-acetylmuramic acid kinase [Humisphaera borealis]QOV87891.1 anhydro-N-acetylmuramic acid kinase [Humisphaera borealis]